MDLSALPRTLISPTSPGHLIDGLRSATPADAERILDIAITAYGPNACNWAEGEAWIRKALVTPTIHCILGWRSFGFVHIERMFWEPKPRAFLLFIAAHPGRDLEPLHVTHMLAAYAKSQGCITLQAGTETAYDASIFLRRIARTSGRLGEATTLTRLAL